MEVTGWRVPTQDEIYPDTPLDQDTAEFPLQTAERHNGGLPPLADDEITVNEIISLTLNPKHSHPYFELRGFTAVDRASPGGGRPFRAFKREPVLRLVESFVNAGPLPPSEAHNYVRVASFKNKNVSFADIFAAIQIVDAEVTFFQINAKHRAEHITAEAAEQVAEILAETEEEKIQEIRAKAVTDLPQQRIAKLLLTKIASQDMPRRTRRAERLFATDQQPTVSYGNPVSAAEIQDRVSFNVPQTYIASLANRLTMRVSIDGFTEAQANLLVDEIEDVWRMHRQDMSPATTRNYELRAQPEDRVQQWQPRYVKNLANRDIPQAERLRGLSEELGQPINTLLAILAHHPRFEGSQAGLDEDNEVIVDANAHKELRTYIQYGHASSLARIPESWQVDKDIAKDCGVDLHGTYGLQAWINSGEYGEKHVIALPVRHGRTISSILFCSPQLARLVYDATTQEKARQQKILELYSKYGEPTVRYTIDPELLDAA